MAQSNDGAKNCQWSTEGSERWICNVNLTESWLGESCRLGAVVGLLSAGPSKPLRSSGPSAATLGKPLLPTTVLQFVKQPIRSNFTEPLMSITPCR